MSSIASFNFLKMMHSLPKFIDSLKCSIYNVMNKKTKELNSIVIHNAFYGGFLGYKKYFSGTSHGIRIKGYKK
jgi:hypothetical protein